MAFDTLTMTAVAAELQVLVGARVQRVAMPSREELLLSLYRPGEEYILLLSSHPQHARVHLTRRRYRSPEQPPPFCMLLRKYLGGARIASLHQPPLERILALRFETHEGLPAVKLIAEIMGRRSNFILVDQNGVILGAVKTATLEQNPRRAVLPGLPYAEVPPQLGLDPAAADPDALAGAILPLLAKGGSPEKALLKTLRAVSPLAARELLYRSRWDDEAPWGSLERLSAALRQLFDGGAPKEACLLSGLNLYAPYRLTHLQDGAGQSFTNMNELLDRHYTELAEAEERRILQGQLRSKVNRRKSRLEQKLEQVEGYLQQAGEAHRYRLYGETLFTYGSLVGRGAEEASLPDPYHPDETIIIPLDPSLDANRNAQKYFRIYRKISNSRMHLKKQIRRLQEELAYCRELLYTIEQGSGASLAEIREELVEAGYMKPLFRRGLSKNKRRRRETPQPLSFRASSGKKILVGRNNRQNDRLTFKIADRRDTWLHAQGLPGSHVILKGEGAPPAEADLREAALLAAYYSRGRELSAVAVDYTEVRHLRRRPGGKPGFVLYEHFKTITVDPRDQELKQLLEQNRSE